MKKIASIIFAIIFGLALIVGGGVFLTGCGKNEDKPELPDSSQGEDLNNKDEESDAPIRAQSNVVHNITFHTQNTSGSYVDSGIGGTITIEFGDDNLNNSYGKHTLGGSATSLYSGYEPSNADAWWGCRRTYFRAYAANTGFSFSYLTYRVNDKENGSGSQLSSGTLYASNIPTYVDVSRGWYDGSCMTINVYFTRNTYTYSYYTKSTASGSYSVYSTKTVYYGATVSLLSSATTPTGYALNGWRVSSATGTFYSAGASYTVGTSSLSWYADYKGVVPSRIIYQTDTNGGGSVVLPRTQQIYSMSLTFYGYGFAANSRGWFESQNKGLNNSYSMMKIAFTAKANASFTIKYRSYGESNYDYAIFSNLDQTLSESYSADTTYYKRTYGESSSSDKSITYSNITAGSHFIYVKYRKDGSTNSNDDTLQVFFESDGQYTNTYTSHWQFVGLMFGTLPTASRTGYTFDGWYTAKTGGTKITSTSIYTGVSTSGYQCLILFAHWTIKTFNITVVKGDTGISDITNPATSWNYNGGNVVGGGKQITVNYGVNQTVSVSTVAGYSFANWSGDSTSTASSIICSVSLEKNYTYTAHSKANSYTVTYNANGGSVSPESKSVTYNSAYGTLATPTRTNYSFAGWWTASSGGTQVTASSTYTTVGNQTLYAHWTPVPITNTVKLRVINKDATYTNTDNANGGTVSVYRYVISGSSSSTSTASQTAASATYSVHQGQLFRLTATAKSGYVFAGFSTSATPSDAIKNPATPPSTTASYYPSSGTTYYVYFKQMSGNVLKYDETDKYFYFEDGYYPQSEASISSGTATGENFTYSDGKNDVSIPVYSYNDERYVKIQKSGTSAWFKFEPIRWRISDYGVAKTERNISRYTALYNLRNYGSYATNFTAVSDLILGVGAMHNTRSVDENLKTDAGKLSGTYSRDLIGYQNVMNATNGVNLNFNYSAGTSYIDIDRYGCTEIGNGNSVYNSVDDFGWAEEYSAPLRIASIKELGEVGFVNRGARASDMVAFILGLDKNQVSYWTRNLSNLGAGIAITPTGTEIRPWLDEVLGMRFAYTFREGSAGDGIFNYARLNYIQSTGTQWIDTGHIVSGEIGFEVDYNISNPIVADTLTSGYVFSAGTYASTQQAYLVTWNTYDTGEFYLNGIRYAGGIVINQRIQTSFKDGIYNSSNGTSYTATNYSVSTTNPLILFGNMSVGGNVAELGKMRLYAFKWYEDNQLMFDFVPVRNAFTGEVGLWDNVSQKFYGNSGVGTFIAG